MQYTHVNTRIDTHTYTQAYAHACTDTHTRYATQHTHTRAMPCTHIRTHTHTHTHTSADTHTHTHTRAHPHTHTPTHIHIHTLSHTIVSAVLSSFQGRTFIEAACPNSPQATSESALSTCKRTGDLQHGFVPPSQLVVLLPQLSTSKRASLDATPLSVHATMRIPAAAVLSGWQEGKEQALDVKHPPALSDANELRLVAYCWGRRLDTATTCIREESVEEQSGQYLKGKQAPIRMNKTRCQVR